MQLRRIIHSLDITGHIAKVPLSDDANPLYAVLDERSIQELENLDCNLVWHIDSVTGRAIAWTTGHNQRAYIDRIIADCKPHTSVIALDGNPLNLKRNNLVHGHSSTAKTNARDSDRIPRPKRITHLISHHWDY